MTANLAGFQRVKALLDVDQSTTSKCQTILAPRTPLNEKYGDKYLIISDLHPYSF